VLYRGGIWHTPIQIRAAASQQKHTKKRFFIVQFQQFHFYELAKAVSLVFRELSTVLDRPVGLIGIVCDLPRFYEDFNTHLQYHLSLYSD